MSHTTRGMTSRRTEGRARQWRGSIGAIPLREGVRFRHWAPTASTLEVLISREGVDEAHALQPEGDGWFSALLPGAGPGDRYRLRLDGSTVIPDPLSRFQPEGIHGPSEIVNPASFDWDDLHWTGLGMDHAVIYEAHVGTATPAGTFQSLAGRLDDLRELGVTFLEIMPVNEFPGERNWGYDGAYWYAPSHVYGGPDGLRGLVNEAHRRGMGVILDVVYNHLGPEGNYLPALSGNRIFTEKHHTPWGAAINYDDVGGEAVREIVIQNALHWIHEYHIDGLRLDAAHAIVDNSPVHVLQELAARVRASTDRRVVLIAEDETNDRWLVTPSDEGGAGLDAVWADDFHHQVRRATAGDDEGYFSAYTGAVDDLCRTLLNGWFYEGQVYPPTGEPRGTPAADLPPRCFVHCIQNHDQVGNRAFGERLNQQVDLSIYRAVSALLLLSPYTPLLWMGQEWAASSPFLYFTDHPEPLGRLVTEGRRSEFRHFSAFADPDVRESIPDPQEETTFLRSKLDWAEVLEDPHRGVRELYRALLALRTEEAALRASSAGETAAHHIGDSALALLRSSRTKDETLLLLVSLGDSLSVSLESHPMLTCPEGRRWSLVLATEEERFGGEGLRGIVLEDETLRMDSPGAIVLKAG